MLKPNSISFTVLLGALGALPPLSIDMGLPALPALAAALHADAGQAGLTLSLFLAGFACAQLLFGPLSDRIGRKPVLLAGLCLFTCSGLVCAMAGSITVLLFARLAQGMGAGAGTVLAFAIVRDLFDGLEARSKLSYVTLVLSFAPIVAPSLGTMATALGDWRAVYALLTVAGLMLTAVIALALGETRPPGAPARSANFAHLLRSSRIVGPALMNAGGFACMFAYVSGSPLVFLRTYQLSGEAYAMLFACTASGLMCGAGLSALLARRRFATGKTLLAGLVLQLGSALFAFAQMSRPSPASLLVLVPTLVLNTLSLGLISPSAAHLALGGAPEEAGSVSALLGASQMAAGAAASALVGWLFARLGAVAMPAAMVGFSATAMAVFLLAPARAP